MKRGIVTAVIFVVLAGCVSGCTPSEVMVGVERDGGEVEIGIGQVLVVELEGNATTGYLWQVTDVPPILRQVGEPTYEAESDLVGAPGVMTLRFEGLEPGEGTLALEYARPWESVAALETYTVKVTVRP